MAKKLWCFKKDQEVVMDALVHGDACSVCKLKSSCFKERIHFSDEGSNLHIYCGFDLYKVVENVRVPRTKYHCHQCNKQTGRIVAEALDQRGRKKYILQCNECRSRWIINVADYKREFTGYTNMNGDYIPPTPKGQGIQIPKHVQLKNEHRNEELRSQFGLSPKKKEPEYIFKPNRGLVLNPRFNKTV